MKKRAAAAAGCCRYAILWEDDRRRALPHRLALARVRRGRRIGLLTDAFSLPGFAHLSSRAWRRGMSLLAGTEFCDLDRRQRRELLNASRDAEINWLAAEQSNSSLTSAMSLMLKIYRRVSPGVHPEAEMGALS